MPIKIKQPRTVKVALVLYDEMLATSVSLPVEMLRAGEALALTKNKNNPFNNCRILDYRLKIPSVLLAMMKRKSQQDLRVNRNKSLTKFFMKII